MCLLPNRKIEHIYVIQNYLQQMFNLKRIYIWPVNIFYVIILRENSWNASTKNVLCLIYKSPKARWRFLTICVLCVMFLSTVLSKFQMIIVESLISINF